MLMVKQIGYEMRKPMIKMITPVLLLSAVTVVNGYGMDAPRGMENFRSRIMNLPDSVLEKDYVFPNEQGILRHLVTGDPRHEVILDTIYYNPNVINPLTKEPQRYQMNKDGTFMPIEGTTLSRQELELLERKEALRRYLENNPSRPANSRMNSRGELPPPYERQDRILTTADGKKKVLERS